jgi:radical SAM protein with 4Fe4S-binding SPASM domain
VIPEGYLIDLHGGAHRVARAMLAQVPCFAAWDRVTLFPAGDLYVCCETRDPLLCYGNIRNDSLRSLLRSPRARDVHDICRAPAVKVAACKSCHIDLFRRLQLARALGYRGPIVE